MTLLVITQYISLAIPVVTFIALAVSVFLFVKNKGTMDALKEAVNTYKQLAEAREARIMQLEEELEFCKKGKKELKEAAEAAALATKVAIDELIAGFKRDLGRGEK